MSSFLQNSTTAWPGSWTDAQEFFDWNPCASKVAIMVSASASGIRSSSDSVFSMIFVK
ncbi:hypothetical protein [Paenibacillus sp. UNC496MF]|uniref:hypothetical protein n=1 Tax=Paenibacillus sp. UNC496MF TaxID=1502753 RepID=UPI0015A51D1B|nr:hypothetical protein [Paenibacillus sp. UNC496MF]